MAEKGHLHYFFREFMRPTEGIYSELFQLILLTPALEDIRFDNFDLVACQMSVVEWARRCADSSGGICKLAGRFPPPPKIKERERDRFLAFRSTRAPSMPASVRLKGKPG